MSYTPPKSTITIFKKDGKLIVVRKPVFPSQIKNCFGCFVGCFGLLFVLALIIFIVFIILFFSMGEDKAYSFLIAVGGYVLIVFIAVFILATRDMLADERVVYPPDYWDETLAFDIDKFVVQNQGSVHSFSYLHDSPPMLRQNPIWPKFMDVIIPGVSLDDYDPPDLCEIYTIFYVNCVDAERIFAALKEHLESITKQE